MRWVGEDSALEERENGSVSVVVLSTEVGNCVDACELCPENSDIEELYTVYWS